MVDIFDFEPFVTLVTDMDATGEDKKLAFLKGIEGDLQM